MNHIELANKYFEDKFHCSQAVFAAFATQYGLIEEQALKIGGCFECGMCKGEVCGAVTGALMVIGLKYGQYNIDDIDSRRKTHELTCLFMDTFKEKNGSYLCRDLLGYDLSLKENIERVRELGLFTTFCPMMVKSAAEILTKILSAKE